MLVKFQSDEKLDHDLDFLKSHFNVGSAAKAVSYAAGQFKCVNHQRETYKLKSEALQKELDELKSLIRNRENIDLKINRLCEEIF